MLLLPPQVSGGCGRNLHQALRICRQHGLSSAAVSLLRTAAIDAMYEGRTGDATALLLAAQDDARLALVLQPGLDVSTSRVFGQIGSYSLGSQMPGEEAELLSLLKDITGSSG